VSVIWRRTTGDCCKENPPAGESIRPNPLSTVGRAV